MIAGSRYEPEPSGEMSLLSVKNEECNHEEKKTEATKNGVYITCARCGMRLKKVDCKLVIEKVVVPETMEKAVCKGGERNGSPD